MAIPVTAIDYDPATDPVHGSGWNNAVRWGGWNWRKPRRGEFFRTCSFCGCIHPEDLAAVPAGSGCGYPLCPEPRGELAHVHFPLPGEDGRDHGFPEGALHRYVDTGWRASWADRKYGWPHKFYVEGLAPRDPSLLHCIGHGSGGDGSRPDRRGNWVEAKDLTRAQKRIIKADGMHARGKFDGWYLFEPRATLHAKFYTIHFADPLISQDAKDAIQAASGLRFTFTDDGRVGWERWESA